MAAVIIWGSTFVATKICLEYLGPIQLVATRFLLAFPLLYLLARLKKLPRVKRNHFGRLAVAAAVFTGHFLLQTAALKLTTATNAGWIIAVAPLAIVLLAAAVLGEPTHRRTWMGIAVATMGIVLLISRGDTASLAWIYSVGDWMLLASTFSWALYTIVTRDVSRRTHPLTVTMTVTLPLAAVGLIQMFLDPTWMPLSQLPAKAAVALLFLAFAGLALAQWFWQEGLAKLGAAKAGIFLYLEPIATTALAVPYLGEPFGWAAALGGSLVLLGVLVAEGS